MIYKLKIKNKEYTIHASSLRAAEAFLEKKYGDTPKEVAAPKYPKVETSTTPVDDVEIAFHKQVEDEDLDLDDETDA
jgi:hypothetical protein